MTDVTVVIPLYNGARFLGETIESLLRQTRTVRIACIDDASTDDSAAVVANIGGGRVELQRNERRLGLAANWNRAAAICQTPYLVIAHQDDVYEPEFVEVLSRLLDEHPRAFAAHTKAMTIDESGDRTRDAAAVYKERFWSADDPQERDPTEEMRLLQQGNYIVAPSVMLRRDTMRTIGLFDTSFEFVTDWEYWMRGLMAGFTMVGTHARLVRFRRHEETATRRSEMTMRRYREEHSLLSRFAAALPGARPFVALENTIVADVARRLCAGDSAGAAQLAAFATEHVPRFRYSPRSLAVRAAIVAGRAGGYVLQALIRSGVEVSAAAHMLQRSGRSRRDVARPAARDGT